MGGQIERKIRWAAWNLFYVLRVKGFTMSMVADVCQEVACIARAYYNEDRQAEEIQGEQLQRWADAVASKLLSTIDLDILPDVPKETDTNTGQ